MAKRKKSKRRKGDIPHCSDPDNHVLVETRKSVFWRKRRRRGKLNEAFATNVDLSRISGPAGRQIVKKLKPAMKGIDAGRITLRISNALRKFLKEKKQLSLSALEGMEMQRDHLLHQLLLAPYEIIVEGQTCRIRIGIEEGCVKKQNTLATNFYFEGLILYGDVTKEGGLKLDIVESKLYAFGLVPTEVCELSLPLPDEDQSWIVLLKVSCLEGNEMAVHPKHYGMKVISVKK
jgi:hypothetical protein